MDFQVEEKSPVVRRVEATIKGDALNKEESKAFARLRGSAKLKGFRKGKVPRSVLKQMYGKQVRAESMQTLVQNALRSIVDDIPGLIHISPWRLLDEKTKDGGFRFELDVEVKPKVEITDYEGIEVKAPPAEVDDERVDQALESLRERHTRMEVVEDRDTCDTGDLVSIDYEAVSDDEAVQQLANSDQLVEIGSGHAIPGLEDGLVGAKVGTEIEIDVQMPEDFPAIPQVAGETITLKVTPTAIKRKVVPELDDELAKATGEADSLEALREKTRGDLLEQSGKRRRDVARGAILAALRERYPFELPQGYINERTQQRIVEQHRYLVQQGLSPQQSMQLLEGMRETVADQVRRSIQDEVILGEIAERESIEVTDEEREAALVERADEHRMPLTRLRRLYEAPEMRETLELEIRFEKAVDKLIEAATIIDASEEELEAEAAAAVTPPETSDDDDDERAVEDASADADDDDDSDDNE